MPLADNLSSDLSASLGSDLAAAASPRVILGALYGNEYKATNPGIVVITGVSDWPDENGVDHALQATGTKQPPLQSNTFNGGPCIAPDGVDDFLLTALATPYAIGTRPYAWIVCQSVPAAGVIGYMSDAAAAVNGFEIGDSGAGFRARRYDSSGASVSTFGSTSDANRHLLHGGFTVGGLDSFVNDGVSFPSGRTGNLTALLTRLALGGTVLGASCSAAKVAYALFARDMPSAAQIASVVTAIKGANWPGYTGNSFGLP